MRLSNCRHLLGRVATGVSLLLLTACQVTDNVAGPDVGRTALRNASSGSPRARDQYIVTLVPTADDVGTVAQELARSAGGQVIKTYAKALRGFAAHIPPAGSRR